MDDKHKYIEILHIEIEDLAQDVRALQEDYRGRSARGEITDYVLKENVALLERESHGIAAVRSCLAMVKPTDYGSLDEMLDDLRRHLDDRLRRGGFEPVVRRLVERKLAKVARYVRRELPSRTG